MRNTRTWSGILVLGILAALSFWLKKDTDDRVGQPISGLDTELNYALRDFEAHYFDEQGRLVGRIQAPLLTNDADSGIGRIVQPLFRVVHEGRQWTILAESATVSPERDKVLFEGSVNLYRQGTPPRQPLEIQTSDVTLEVDPRVAHSDQEVSLSEGESTLRARGFWLDMENDRFQLLHDVRGAYALR